MPSLLSFTSSAISRCLSWVNTGGGGGVAGESRAWARGGECEGRTDGRVRSKRGRAGRRQTGCLGSDALGCVFQGIQSPICPSYPCTPGIIPGPRKVGYRQISRPWCQSEEVVQGPSQLLPCSLVASPAVKDTNRWALCSTENVFFVMQHNFLARFISPKYIFLLMVMPV